MAEIHFELKGVRERSITPEETEKIENNFTYHSPKLNQLPRYETIRLIFKEVAYFLCRVCPQSRELSLALTNLEQAVFWANAAIARNEKEEPTDGT